MASVTDSYLRSQLIERRQRLQSAITRETQAPQLIRLLEEVDGALSRMDTGSFGLCETCHEPIEGERLVADPTVRFCLDHLAEHEQRALEQDFELAARIQRRLLPARESRFGIWETSYRFEPAGPVSGDWCDLVQPAGEDDLYVLLGDVSGKGVPAAILMAHLHAVFRTLIAEGDRPDRLVERANRLFRESAMSPYFATLVCARASSTGDVEICNAGHPPPFLLTPQGAQTVQATGLPVGAFYSSDFSSTVVHLDPGDGLVLYTDGLTEARDRDGQEYGVERVEQLLARGRFESAASVVQDCLADLESFADGAPRTDDLTLLVVRRRE